MNKSLLIIILGTITFNIFGQTIPNISTLIDEATKDSGLFIGFYPVKKINLKLADTAFYKDDVKRKYNYTLDQELLIDLISNSKSLDTTKWTENDFKKNILIESLDDYINPKEVIKKFGLTDKTQIKKLKQQIANYNSADHFNKNIYYFSRPVFNSTKTYAIISHGNGNKGLMGRDYVSLFYYNGNTWEKIGVVMRWIY